MQIMNHKEPVQVYYSIHLGILIFIDFTKF